MKGEVLGRPMSAARDEDVDVHLASDGAESLRVAQRHHLVTMQHSNSQRAMLQHQRGRERRVLQIDDR